MTINGWAQIALFCGLVLLLTRPLGGYLDNVMAGRRTLLSPVLRPVERHGLDRHLLALRLDRSPARMRRSSQVIRS